MPLHRVITIAGFTPDPLWSLDQTTPPSGPGGNSPFLVPVVASSPGLWRIQWWGVGYDGPDESASPVDSTGITWDAAMVLRTQGTRDTVPEYTRLSSISETLGAPIESGRRAAELDLPAGVEAWLSIIAFTPAGAATHFHIKYDVRRVNG